MIAAQPEISYTTVVSTIRCYAVTSGELEGSTYVEWSGHFSSDADAGMLNTSACPCVSWLTVLTLGVIQDAKFKRREALADLAQAAKKM